MSNSSDLSPLSSPDTRSEDVVLSANPSPSSMVESNPFDMGSPRRPREPHQAGSPRGPQSDFPTSNDYSSSVSGHCRPTTTSTPTARSSKPITIELPAPKKVTSSGSVYTPPAPLSARGDLPGGYFPLHEDTSRVYRQHPFQLDASNARLRSIERAHETSSPQTASVVPDTSGSDSQQARVSRSAAMADRSMPPPPRLDAAELPPSRSQSRSSTPVASYMPIGSQGSPLPMGKYYPTNYEQRQDEKRRAQNSRPSSAGSLHTMSDSMVPTVNQSPAMGHSRNESEAKRRLQQYQRDMIAQATLALNGGNISAATLSSLRTIGFNTMAKPSKPRLMPLGSPGPVTPMELEGADDGYLGIHGASDLQEEEIARAIRAEEERKRREGASSPAVELGAGTF
ncbi:hypothetical protein F5Y15DRAFT_416118 [Xylariaceae sp. FL0016]|nr:hypothetical protein F5Y15DRAFT_416118 [Xylariaceae sp. FL0016]